MSLGEACVPSSIGETPVLCVDLDGTLLITDVLWESMLVLLKQQPWMIIMLPWWLLKGKAYFKRQIAGRVKLNPATLPYRQDVLSFLRQEKKAGRIIVLTTASDRQAVEAIAEHLGIFAEVIASDGTINLAGRAKCRAIEQRFGERRFDYIGNGRVDLPLWRSANAALLVAPSKRLLNQAKSSSSVQQVFSAETNRLLAALKVLRIHQWVKNILLLVPLVTSHKVFDGGLLWKALGAFLAFSLCASSVYILNDLFDLESDRQHPRKRFRPLAAGMLSIPTGMFVLALVLLCGLLLATLSLPVLFTAILLVYLATTTLYSFHLKRIAIADVIVLAGLYVLRVLAGGVAVGISVSTWLLAFSMFLFLSLALMKRFAELSVLQAEHRERAAGRGYVSSDKEWLANMGAASGYLSVLVLALYINSKDVEALYRHPQVLWLACPLLLFWITRMWALAHRGQIDDDPIMVTIKDRLSYGVGVAVAVVLFAAL